MSHPLFILISMEAQLHLLPNETDNATSDWHLDQHTRELGREGIREARAALRSALRNRHDADADHASAA